MNILRLPTESCSLRGSQLACATKEGFALIEYSEEDNGVKKAYLKYLARPLEHDPRRSEAQRFNDGACDAMGRFFAGTLTMESREPPDYKGQLWCYDPRTGEAKLVDDDILVCAANCVNAGLQADDQAQESNGLGWSADNKTL